MHKRLNHIDKNIIQHKFQVIQKILTILKDNLHNVIHKKAREHILHSTSSFFFQIRNIFFYTFFQVQLTLFSNIMLTQNSTLKKRINEKVQLTYKALQTALFKVAQKKSLFSSEDHVLVQFFKTVSTQNHTHIMLRCITSCTSG